VQWVGYRYVYQHSIRKSDGLKVTGVGNYWTTQESVPMCFWGGAGALGGERGVQRGERGLQAWGAGREKPLVLSLNRFFLRTRGEEGHCICAFVELVFYHATGRMPYRTH
jgi:hypothetical protein